MRNTPWVLFVVVMATAGMTGTRLWASAEQQVVAFDQLTQGYNLISFGNTTFGGNYGDTQGAIAVNGNLTMHGSGQIAEHAGAGAGKPSLYVTGQLNLDAGQYTRLKNGYAYLPNASGTWNSSTKQLTKSNGGVYSAVNSNHPLSSTDPRSTQGQAPWNWAALNSSLVNVSNALAASASTGTIGVSGQNMTFNTNGQTSGVAVFTLDGNAFKGSIFDANGDGVFDQNNERISNFSINIPSDMVYVINVVNFGGKTLLDGINANNAGASNERLLWNIIPSNGNTGTVTLGKAGSYFNGSVLAPLVDIKNNQGTAPVGQIIAGSYTHNGGELHYADFGTPVSFSVVPEPGTWGVFGVGFCAVSMLFRRRGRQASRA
jgi:choice-of-anchor A domain-containing protein